MRRRDGYTRDQFGQSRYDTDRNGCDTRNDILRRDLTSRQMANACKVMAGTLAVDPYTAASIRFTCGGASEIDIDHVVALSDAWQKGAASWTADRRGQTLLEHSEWGLNPDRGDERGSTLPSERLRCHRPVSRPAGQ